MKRSCLRSPWAAKPISAAVLGWALATASGQPGFVRSASASVEMDHKFALETIGFLKSWDNVDGLFSDYVAQAYKEYFSKSSRFTLQDLSKADALLSSSKLPYYKVIEDNEILGQLARSSRSQSIIRTKIYKEGASYRFTLDWLHSPKMDVLASESFVLEEPRDGRSFGLGDVRGSLTHALDALLKKVPFVAHLTGRDGNSVTVNVGLNLDLKPGDTMTVSTIEEVKKHPLLKSIVEWRMAKTGRIEVEEVDRGLAFCRVIEEEPGRQVARYQKVTQISVKPDSPPEQKIVYESAEEKKKAADEPPRLGWISGGMLLGSFGRQFSSLDSTVHKDGSGLLAGMKAEGQLWLTRDWFAEAAFGYSFSSFSQTDVPTGVTSSTSGTASLLSSRIDFGYSYLVTGEFFGPKAWVKLGYHSYNYNFVIDANERLAPVSFKGVFLGVGGDLPIRDRYGAQMNLDFGLLRGGEETGGVAGDSSGATDIEFFLGGYFRYSPKMSIKMGVNFVAHGLDFSSGATLTHRAVNVAPSLVFYF